MELSLNALLLPDHEAERGAGELVSLAQLILQVPEVGGRHVPRMTDKQREDRWLGGHLRDKGRFRHRRRLVLTDRQWVDGEDLLQPGIQCSGGDTFRKHGMHVVEKREETAEGFGFDG